MRRCKLCGKRIWIFYSKSSDGLYHPDCRIKALEKEWSDLLMENIKLVVKTEILQHEIDFHG